MIINEPEHYVLLKLPFSFSSYSEKKFVHKYRTNCALLWRLSKSILEVSPSNWIQPNNINTKALMCVRWSLLFCINIHIYITIISLLLSPEILWFNDSLNHAYIHITVNMLSTHIQAVFLWRGIVWCSTLIIITTLSNINATKYRYWWFWNKNKFKTFAY